MIKRFKLLRLVYRAVQCKESQDIIAGLESMTDNAGEEQRDVQMDNESSNIEDESQYYD